MKKNFFIVAGVIVICSSILFLTSCTKQNEKISMDNKNTPNVDMSSMISQSNKDIMNKYITEFLIKAYSKYYIVNSVKCEFIKGNIKDGKIETIILTTISSNVPPKDPETVPYIIEAKEKAQRETDPKIKSVLQNVYETMAKEYGKPNDTNYMYKFTANLINGEIDKNSIRLYNEVDDYNGEGNLLGVKYVPAEEYLPGK